MVSEYYKDPERTMEAFRNLMFHTGDLACYDEEGILHFRSRKQDRIRRRGENVSAAELEWVVMKHECVLDAAAYGVASELGEEDVKLDVVLREPLALDGAARVADREPAALHGPALPRGPRELPEDAERADREVQADRRSRRPAGGVRRRARQGSTADGAQDVYS